LKLAIHLLENPGVAAKLTNVIGKPIELGIELLPESWSEKIAEITKASLTKAVDTAVFTMKNQSGTVSSNLFHKIAVAATGGAGGFLGLPGLAIELPVSTTIMLRSIADIARSENEDIQSIESKLACIEVFALGSPRKSDDATESGYFVVRASLARSLASATKFIIEKGLVEEGAPALIRLIVQISQRFSIQVTEKAAAQAIPGIGALGGAIINSIFIDHFQDMARGHFTVRRLERKYGKEEVETMYKRLFADGD